MEGIFEETKNIRNHKNSLSMDLALLILNLLLDQRFLPRFNQREGKFMYLNDLIRKS